MKTKLKKLVRSAKCSVLSAALCAVGLAAFAEEPAGSEANPWQVGSPNAEDVTAWTNGVGGLTVEGTGAMMDFNHDTPPWSSVKGTIITVEIGSGVMNIGDKSFSACKGLTSVTIPEGVTNIGDNAFANCSALKSVTILSSVTSIGQKAFYKCSMVAELKVQSIEDWCKVVLDNGDSNPLGYSEIATPKLIAGGKEITELVIPSTITEIRNYTFSNCRGVSSVSIPLSVTSIGEIAFAGCSGLTSVTIPSSVTNIGFCAFNNCSGLTSVMVMRESPPVGDTVFGDISKFNGTIFVPPASGESYKAAEGWSVYEAKIRPAYMVSGVAEHGSLVFDKVCFPVESYTEPTETVTVTVTADKGYQLKSLVYNDGTDRDITEAKSFTMPLACVTVTAVFEEAAKPDEEVVAFDEATFVLGPALAVANVTTATHWPWDGKIDVTCDLTGAGNVQLSAALTTNGVTVCTATAENVTGATVIDLDQVGGVTNGVKFVWNAKADCPAGFNSKDTKVKVTAKKFTPKPLGGVQLWKDGPFWATSNLGEPESHDPAHPQEYGALYKFDDAAQAVTDALGTEWRVPTDEEFKKLAGKNDGDQVCSNVWTTCNGVKGCRFFGMTSGYEDKNIFLPAAGYDLDDGRKNAGDRGYYWSSAEMLADFAWLLRFDEEDDPYLGFDNRSHGLSVRAVRDAK